MWSLQKVERMQPYVRIYNNNVIKKGCKQSKISNLIKLENELLTHNNIYLYNGNKLLYEAMSLIDMINYCKNNNIYLGKQSSISSYKSKISSLARSNKLYLGVYEFTYKPKNKNHIKRDCYLFEFWLIDKFGNIVHSIKGLDNFAKETKIPKKNIINNMKGITNSILYTNLKHTIKWKVIQNIELLQKK